MIKFWLSEQVNVGCVERWRVNRESVFKRSSICMSNTKHNEHFQPLYPYYRIMFGFAITPHTCSLHLSYNLHFAGTPSCRYFLWGGSGCLHASLFHPSFIQICLYGTFSTHASHSLKPPHTTALAQLP